MDFQIKFEINPAIYLRDPESSELGKKIISNAIDLIYELGFEQFTFKKLANKMDSTEASIYRYFENKHMLLVYILNLYWNFMEYLVRYKVDQIPDKKEKLKSVIQLLTEELSISFGHIDYNMKYLNHIVIVESSKTYLTKEISKINEIGVFKSYKDLCAKIADIISFYKPSYKYPRTLSTTLIEASHQQQFFIQQLPRLTDVNKVKKKDFTKLFLEDLVFKVLN